MRVLVATKELQRRELGDYAFTVEGELVTAEVSECSTPQRCGCGRGFPGLASSKATTTALVAELEHLSEDDLREVLADWLERAGWLELFRGDEEMLADLVDEHVETIETICAAFPVGTIVERNGTLVSARALPFAA